MEHIYVHTENVRSCVNIHVAKLYLIGISVLVNITWRLQYELYHTMQYYAKNNTTYIIPCELNTIIL